MRLLRNKKGISVLELTIVVSVIGLSLAVATPGIQNLRRTNNLSQNADYFAAQLRLARHAAISEDVQRLVIWSSISHGWVIIEDTNSDGYYQGGEPYTGPYFLPDGLRLANGSSDGFGSYSFTFDRKGRASQTGSLYFLDDRDRKVKLTVVASTGQVKVTKKT